MVADAERFQQGMADVAELAKAELADLWSSLDVSQPEAALQELRRYVPILNERYGRLATSVAVEWFNEMRAAAGVRGRFAAMSAALTPDQVIQERIGSAGVHLIDGDPDDTLAALSTSLTKFVLQPGRNTVRESIFRDPRGRGWRRVVRPGACDFCRMLEGRGGVYMERTVRFAAHGECYCGCVPNWDPSAPEVDVEMYRQSTRTANMSEGQRRRLREGAQDWIARNL